MKTLDRLDGWLNALTGLGTRARDKAVSGVFAREGQVDDETLEALYEESDVARTIVDAVPEAMFREGFSVECSEEGFDAAALTGAVEALGLREKFVDALCWERVFGGSALVLGLDDGRRPDEPLDVKSLRALRFVNVLDKRDVFPIAWHNDPRESRFGLPSVYRVHYVLRGAAIAREPDRTGQVGSVEVHASRLVIFGGARVTTRSRLRRNGWGVSLLSRCYAPMRAFAQNWLSVENILTDASQGVFKMRGVIEALSQQGSQYVETRMRLLDMSRSVARAIVVDADNEEFSRRDTSLSGLPELLDRTAQRLASAARMPLTVLMGVSAAGLNATGEGDSRNWHDAVAAERSVSVLPEMRRVLGLLLASREGPTKGVVPKAWEIVFPPLWTPSDLEDAQASAARSSSDVALINAGVVLPEEVALRRARELGLSQDRITRSIEELETVDLPEPLATAPGAPASPVSEDPEAKDPATALNGAQVTALLEVVAAVAARRIPRETGVEALTAAFPLDREAAERLLGPTGRTFFAQPE